jgi:predicted negative regulator of RcsB-dependent stress response
MSSEATDSTSIYEIMAWFEVNKKRLIAGLIVVGILAFAISLMVYLRKQKEIEANAALLRLAPKAQSGEAPSAIDAADFLKITATYPSTSAGERASLQAATAFFSEQKYDEAMDQFKRFQSAYSGSRLLPQAAMGVAACLEAKDKNDDAIKAYQDVAARFSSHAVAAQAKLALGRLSEEKKQYDQALRYYDEVTPQGPRSVWSSEASDRRQLLLAQFPNLDPKPASANLPAAPATNVDAQALKSLLESAAKTNAPANPMPKAVTNAVPKPATNPVPKAATDVAKPSTNK